MEAVEAAGGKPFMFGTPVVADGETMGMEGMRYSLITRDLIADCIETMHEVLKGGWGWRGACGTKKGD